MNEGKGQLDKIVIHFTDYLSDNMIINELMTDDV